MLKGFGLKGFILPDHQFLAVWPCNMTCPLELQFPHLYHWDDNGTYKHPGEYLVKRLTPVLQRGSGGALSLYSSLSVIWPVSNNTEFVLKFSDSKPICPLSFPLLKITKLLFLSSAPNPHLDLMRTSSPLLMKVSYFTSKEIDINNAFFLSMNHICIALRMLRTQFSPPNPLFLSFYVYN